MKRVFLAFVVSIVVLSGCARTQKFASTDAHIVIGLQVSPKMRQEAAGLFTPSMRSTVDLEHHPLRPDVPRQRVSVSANDGWEYTVLPVVSGIYSLHSITIQGGGALGREVTKLSESSRKADGSSRVQGSYLFDIPEGSVAYIGSFDIDGSYSPVKIELLANLAKAKEAVEKAGLDPASMQVIKRNVFRGMQKASAATQSGS